MLDRGSSGRRSSSSTSTPQIGDTFRVRLAQARPAAAAVLGLGFSTGSWSGLPLPLDLGWLGAPGCTLSTALDLTQAVMTNAAGDASFSFSLPNSIYLLGLRFYNQYLVTEPTVNALGLVLSNGGAGLIGNQ